MNIKKILASAFMSVFALAIVANVAFAAHNPPIINVNDSDACAETIFTGTITDPNGGHKATTYLVVDDGTSVQYVNVPTDGTNASISVGPFSETTSVFWRVFGGGERDYDQPQWNGYGGPDFTSDINDYAAINEWGFVVAGIANDNPFTTWNEVEVDACDDEAPVVDITAPFDGAVLNGLVDITGSVTDNVELSHYNLSLYLASTDLSDGDTHSGDRINTGWCSGTVNLSSDFTGTFCDDWDTSVYPDGEYQIRLAARDAAGNRDISDPYTGGTTSVHVVKVFMVNNNIAESANQCKKDGWEDLNDHLGNTFKNQGDCVSYVATEGKNLGAGPSIFE